MCSSPLRFATSVLCVLLAWLTAHAQSDLSLSLSVTNENAAIYNNITYTLTVTNQGPKTATGVVVKAPTESLNGAYGLVYTDAKTVSGTYNVVSNTWHLAPLPSGTSVKLDLVLYALSGKRPRFFAEIIASDQTDPDSSPHNGNPDLGAREDDEVLRSIPPASSCQLDIEVTRSRCVTVPGSEPNFQYALRVEANDPTVQFVEVSSDSQFAQVRIFPAGVEFPSDTNVWLSAILNQGIDKFDVYVRPLGKPNCIDKIKVTAPPGCLATTPSCLAPFYFPDLYCSNDGQNLIIRVDLMPETTRSRLSPSDRFRVLLNGNLLREGVVFSSFYLGLQGGIPMTSELTTLRIERISDGACISENTFIPTDYCVAPNTAFCNQQGIFPWSEWIKRVQIGTLDRSSGKSQITNFTNVNPADPTSSATLEAGDSTPFTITVGYSWFTYDNYITMYLDSDRNGSFSQAEQIYSGKVPKVTSGNNVQAILSGKAFIPTNAENGLTKLKIVLNRNAPATVCGAVEYGEVEVYNVRIGGGLNNSPCGPVNFQILGVECDPNGTPSVSEDDQYFVKYKFDFPGYEGTPCFAGSYWLNPDGSFSFPPTNTNSITQGTVGAVSTYGPVSINDFPKINFRVLGAFCNTDYVLVEAPAERCSNQTPTNSANCSAQSNFPWEDWISQVKIRNFTQNSGKATYTKHPTTVPLSLGQNPISVRAAYSYQTYDEYVRVWVDFDQDSIYESNEIAFEGVISRPVNGVPYKDITGQLQVPTTAKSGITRMRVRMSRFRYPEACNDQAYGEVEDFTVQIAAGLNLQNGPQLPVSTIITDQGFYPNPARHVVYLQFEPRQNAHIALINHLGQTVLRREFTSTETTEELDLSHIPSGHYFIQIHIAGERPRTHGLVLENE